MTPSKVLVIEDNLDHLKFVDRTLARELQWETVPARSVGDGVVCLTTPEKQQFALILLDLSLPDGLGLDNLRRILDHCGQIPVVVLTAECDGNLAAQAVRDGAEDFLVKQETTPGGLVRAVRNSLERRQTREELISDPLIDRLTSMYNRRAFLALAEQQVAIARRTRQSITLLIGDLDGLRKINEDGGTEAGDQALIFASRILRVTLRDSDLVARLRGDEFAMLMAGCSPMETEEVLERIKWRLASKGLTMTIGVGRVGPGENVPLDVLMILADESLLEERRSLTFPRDPSLNRDRRRKWPSTSRLQ